ncbi:MAG TPA: gamma-glutamyl-gamma-aminobutyrate hydrolase family protein [Candidatus Limnocylindrales bacterium]|nr:gamma-glutamyl-gamma-aminobutyrate hydrolase family protein [Candidatus Limnocylindrales bacterium]
MTLIGLTLRVQPGKDSLPKLALNKTYFDALTNAGAEVLPIPAFAGARADPYYDMLDGLVIPGGPDVEPARYGAVTRSDANVHTNHDLDDLEFALLDRALRDGMPVLAICRGIQVLNVACGGTLWQDVHVEGATQRPHDCEPRDSLVHELSVDPDSLLGRTLGATRIAVNSLHHQAIRDLGSQLRAVARSDDGIIEGVEIPERPFVVGMQCHPEELVANAEWAQRLFARLVDAAAKYRSLGERDLTNQR